MELLNEEGQFTGEASEFDLTLLDPLSIDAQLETFALEYQKLQQALRKSHESENRFINKCKNLSKGIRASSHKLTAITALHQADLKRKKNFMSQISSNKTKADALAAEVAAGRERAVAFRAELVKLAADLENSSNDAIRQQRKQIEELDEQVAAQTAIRDEDRTGLTSLRTANVQAFNRLESILNRQKEELPHLEAIEKKIKSIEDDTSAETRKKNDLERRMKQLQATVAERSENIRIKKEIVDRALQELADVESQAEQAHAIVAQHEEQYRLLCERAADEDKQLLALQEENLTLQRIVKKDRQDLEQTKADTRYAKRMAEQQRRALEAMREKVAQLEKDTRDSDATKADWAAKVKQQQAQVTLMQMKLSQNAKAMETCLREREVLAANHMAKGEQVREKESLLAISKSTLKNVKNEHQGYLASMRHLTQVADALTREKQSHEVELSKRQLQIARATEEVMHREGIVQALQRQILQNEGKLKQQNNLFETVRADRNMYRKLLIEQKNEMDDFQRKFTNLNMQIKQLKQEIAEKDLGFVTEHFNLGHVRADIAVLKSQNEGSGTRLREVDGEIKNQAEQIRKLTSIISDADEELRVQLQQYNTIVNEQRVLNQQLIQRNEELAQLYEQLKLQNSLLTKGEEAYREKAQLAKQLEEQAASVNGQLENVLNDLAKFEELTGTIAHVEKELIQERLRVTALSDELRKPINLHRWRRLQDTDTATYNMVARVRSLQKAIIRKSDAVVKKDAAIQKKEKLYVDLRKVLARQPGSEAAEQLRLYARTLREKRSRFKAMKSELKMYQAKVYEYKYELSRVAQELQLIKLDYFRRRRREVQNANRGAGDSAAGGDLMNEEDVDAIGFAPSGIDPEEAAIDEMDVVQRPTTSGGGDTAGATTMVVNEQEDEEEDEEEDLPVDSTST